MRLRVVMEDKDGEKWKRRREKGTRNRRRQEEKQEDEATVEDKEDHLRRLINQDLRVYLCVAIYSITAKQRRYLNRTDGQESHPINQASIIEGDLATCKNPSAVVQSRIKQARVVVLLLTPCARCRVGRRRPRRSRPATW